MKDSPKPHHRRKTPPKPTTQRELFTASQERILTCPISITPITIDTCAWLRTQKDESCDGCPNQNR